MRREFDFSTLTSSLCVDLQPDAAHRKLHQVGTTGLSKCVDPAAALEEYPEKGFVAVTFEPGFPCGLLDDRS